MIDPKGFDGLGGCPDCGQDHGADGTHVEAVVSLPAVLGEAYDRGGEAAISATRQIVNVFLKMAEQVGDPVEGMVRAHAISLAVSQIVGGFAKETVDLAIAARQKKDEASR